MEPGRLVSSGDLFRFDQLYIAFDVALRVTTTLHALLLLLLLLLLFAVV